MNNSRTENSIKNAFYGVIHIFVETLGPFILKTQLLRILGEQYLGLNNLFHSVISVLSLAEIGFSKAIGYYLYKPIANNDEKEVSALLNLFRKIYFYIGTFILVVGLSLIPFLDKLIKGGNTTDVNLTYIYLIYLFESVVNYFFFAHYEALLTAAQKNFISDKIATIAELIIYACRLFVLIKYRNYYLFIFFIPVLAIIRKIVVAIVAKRIYPQYKCQGTVDSNKKKRIFSSTIDIAIHRFGETISSSLGSIVVSMSLGLTAVAIYGNYNYIYVSMMVLISTCISSITSSIGNSMIKNTTERNVEIFKMTDSLINWMICWSASCMFCLYNDFMTLWVGEKLTMNTVYAAVFSLLFYTMCIGKNVLTFKEANGNWRNDRVRPLISGLLCAALMMVLNFQFGSIGVAISTIIVTVLIDIPWQAFVVFNNYFKKDFKKYLIHLVYETIIAIMVSGLSFLAVRKIGCGNYIAFILKGILCFAISNVIYLPFKMKDNIFKQSVGLLKNNIFRMVKKES